MNIHSIVIDGGNSKFLIEPIQRQFPDSMDYWDGNWVVARFRAHAPGFQADLTKTFHLSELAWLQNALSKIHTELTGHVEWKPMDGFLELTAEMDKLGRVLWTIELMHHYGRETKAKLSLVLQNDQTCLSDILNQISLPDTF